MKKSSIWLWTLAAFFAFFVFGYSDNLKGPIMPALLADLHFDYAMGGTILLGIYVGFMIATLTTGLIADMLGKKAVLLTAGACLTLGISGYSSFSAPLALGFSMTILGFGLGALELGCNALIVELHPTDKVRYLNLMALMHGMGSMAAPLATGLLLAASYSWRTVYRLDLIFVAFLILYVSLNHYPAGASAPSEKIDFKHLGRAAFTPRLVWFYLSIALYVATEIGLASWLVEYLQKIRLQSVEQSTQALSQYFGLMMAGRFLGSFVIDRLGHLKSILVAMLAACVTIAIGLFGPALALSLSGLFLSIVFPTITASVSDGLTENTNSILGLLFTFAGLGGMLGPWLVGLASHWFGIGIGFGLPLGFAVLTTLAILTLFRLAPHPQQKQPA
jgi:fucose permease